MNNILSYFCVKLFKMNKTLILVFLVFVFFNIEAQNVGQNTDTIINYTDINGYKQGNWVKKYFNGNIKYKGYFVNDKPVGEFIRYDQKGRIKANLNCYETGDSVLLNFIYTNGETAAVGIYLEQKKHRQWKYYNDKGHLSTIENYYNGVRHGVFITYFANDSVYEKKEYKNGNLHGIYLRNYSNGKINFLTYYKDSLRHGKFYVYNNEGFPLIHGNYVHDRKDGSWIYYDDKGIEKFQIKYSSGVAENNEELREKENEEIKKLEQNKDKCIDPENFKQNPEEYLFRKENYK